MLRLVLRDDDREYPVAGDVEPLDLTRVADALELVANVSDAQVTAMQARAMRQRKPLRVALLGSPRLTVVDGQLGLRA